MKWFVNQNSRVHGPYDNTEIQGLVQTMGASSRTTFLWTRGLNEWITADKWTPSIAQSTQSERQFAPVADVETRRQVEANTLSHFNPAAVDPAKPTKPAPVAQERRYKVQYNFIDQDPMTREELLSFTLKQDDVSKIAVFDATAREWKEIYSIPEIAEKLGISRRKNARVPILAQFVGTVNDTKINARVVTISTGGMGLTDTYDLKIGELVNGQVTSPHFFTPLNIQSQVNYTGTDGYVGLQFNFLNDDVAALITEYVEKFSH
jgi:PilZ domain/GYF domain 2